MEPAEETNGHAIAMVSHFDQLLSFSPIRTTPVAHTYVQLTAPQFPPNQKYFRAEHLQQWRYHYLRPSIIFTPHSAALTL